MRIITFFRRLQMFIVSSTECVKLCWYISGTYHAVHWHITGANTYEDMKIIWEQLHEAHLKYDALLGRSSVHTYPFGKPENK